MAWSIDCMPRGPQTLLPFRSPAAPQTKMPVQTLRMSVSAVLAAWAASQFVISGSSKLRVGSGPGTRMMSSLPGCTSGSDRWWVQRRLAPAVSGMGSPG